MAKSVTDLVTDITERISLPTDDDDRWNTAAVVRAINNAMEERVIPDLLKYAQEYLVHRKIIPLRANGAILFPSLTFPIPKRAVGRTLREVKFIEPGALSDRDEINLPLTSLNESDLYQNRYMTGYQVPTAWYLDNDSIKLIGNSETLDGSLSLYYFLEPATIVNKTTEFASITNLTYNAATTVLTVTTNSVTGTEFDTISTGTKLYDLYRASTGAVLRSDIALTRATATTFTMTGNWDADDIKDLTAFQENGLPVATPYTSELYLLPAGQSQFSQLPYEFDQILVLHVCSRILESMGDIDGLRVNEERLRAAYEAITSVMGNRSKGQRKVVSNHRGIASNQRRWRFGYGRN